MRQSTGEIQSPCWKPPIASYTFQETIWWKPVLAYSLQTYELFLLKKKLVIKSLHAFLQCPKGIFYWFVFLCCFVFVLLCFVIVFVLGFKV